MRSTCSFHLRRPPLTHRVSEGGCYDEVDAYARQAHAYLDNIGEDFIVVRLLCHS
jgi:hypothetical protein